MEGFPGKTIPVGGIAYYITPPVSLVNVFTDPFHTVFYLTFFLMSCAMFSKAWMEVSGSSSQVGVIQGQDGGVLVCLEKRWRRRSREGLNATNDRVCPVGCRVGLLHPPLIVRHYVCISSWWKSRISVVFERVKGIKTDRRMQARFAPLVVFCKQNPP